MRIESIQQVEKLLPKPYIERLLHDTLLTHLREPEVTVLYGARQVGKSSEIRHLIRSLLRTSEKKEIFYFNLDVIPKDFEHPDTFLASLQAQKKYPAAKTYIFLDEAQRLPNIGLFVKYLYDQKANLKFILTGSASLDIREKIKEPLTGRKREFYLGPLILKEILPFKGIDYKKISGRFQQLDEILEEYLFYGGYPAVVTESIPKKKEELLSEIADSYIMRDITEMFRISNPFHIRTVANFMAEYIGNILSKEAISHATALKISEVEKVLTALQKTFVLFLVQPFFRHRSRELTHRPKIYFYDLGIRNAILQKKPQGLFAQEKGQLFENAVALQLIAPYGIDRIHFWRTKNQTEVDFVTEKTDKKIDVWEAKYSFRKGTMPKNVRSFQETYAALIDTVQIISADTYYKLCSLP